MKKNKLNIIVMIVFMLILTACSNNKEKITTCTSSINESVSNYELNTTYEIYHVNNIVKKIITREEIKADNPATLDIFEHSLNQTYTSMNETYGGYEFHVDNINDNYMMFYLTQDYENMDLNLLVKNDYEKKKYMNKNNEFVADKLIDMYKKLGVKCK